MGQKLLMKGSIGWLILSAIVENDNEPTSALSLVSRINNGKRVDQPFKMMHENICYGVSQMIGLGWLATTNGTSYHMTESGLSIFNNL